jgi:peptide/nickel transport system substrate-binding protein
VVRYWRNVGIDASFVSREQTLLSSRVESNKHDAAVWSCSGGVDAQFDPFYTFPLDVRSQFAVEWGKWYDSGGKEGQKPPAAPLRQMRLYDHWKTLSSTKERLEVFGEIMQIATEEFYTIGVIQPTQEYGVVSNRLHNVPPGVVASTEYPHPGPSNPCQYFIDE